jgi:hypothetical protein
MSETTDWRGSSDPAAPFSSDTTQCLNGLFSSGYSTDANLDGAFTISDLWSLLKDVLTVPADLFRAWIYGTDIGKFFEVTCAKTSGFSFLLSSIVVIALVYLTVEGFQTFFERQERRRVERWWEKERKEKGYESLESESHKE